MRLLLKVSTCFFMMLIEVKFLLIALKFSVVDSLVFMSCWERVAKSSFKESILAFKDF